MRGSFSSTIAPGGTYTKQIWFVVPEPKAGLHTFQVECIDQQGNIAFSRTVAMVFGPPPVCQLSAAVDSGDWSRVFMIATASSLNSTIQSIIYSVDGTANPVVASRANHETDSLSPGPHMFSLRCTDALNQSTDSNVVTLNLAPPQPMERVFHESEGNNLSTQSNVVAGIYNVIRGSTSAGDDDWFAVVPPGTDRTVCIASAKTNSNGCDPDTNLYIVSQGAPVFVDSMQLLPSRSAINDLTYICAHVGDDGYVYVEQAGDVFSQCGRIDYDILLQYR
jgi:hypothetical protein